MAEQGRFAVVSSLSPYSLCPAHPRCAGFVTPIVYYYPVFFFAVLVHRTTRDFERCHRKYGKDWEGEYSVATRQIERETALNGMARGVGRDGTALTTPPPPRRIFHLKHSRVHASRPIQVHSRRLLRQGRPHLRSANRWAEEGTQAQRPYCFSRRTGSAGSTQSDGPAIVHARIECRVQHSLARYTAMSRLLHVQPIPVPPSPLSLLYCDAAMRAAPTLGN